MRNNVLNFELGQPTYVAFKYTKGKPYTSDFGNGYTYKLADRADGTLKVDRPGGPTVGGDQQSRPVVDSSVQQHCQNGSTPPLSTWGMPVLRQALFAVIDDAAEAERYAAGKGLSIRFSGEDIRCMANTAVYQCRAREGVRWPQTKLSTSNSWIGTTCNLSKVL